MKNSDRPCFYNENIDFMTSFRTPSGCWGEEIGQPPRKWQLDHQTLLSQAQEITLRVSMKTRDQWEEPPPRAKLQQLTTAHDHGGNEIKPCRISIKVSFPIQKQKPKKTSMGLGSNQKHPDMYHCEQILLSMKTEEAAIKTTYLAHSRNRIPRLREMER